jgi:catechol 2,3-dioxygenase-like lactoylglutathione lyase family enzyme
MRLHHAYHTVPADGAAALRQFYGELLGLPEIPKASILADSPLIWFAVGEDHLHFCLNKDWERGHIDHHIALYVEDVEPVLARLRAAGLEIYDKEPFHDYGYTRHYVYDPFGRQVEMISPLEAEHAAPSGSARA